MTTKLDKYKPDILDGTPHSIRKFKPNSGDESTDVMFSDGNENTNVLAFGSLHDNRFSKSAGQVVGGGGAFAPANVSYLPRDFAMTAEQLHGGDYMQDHRYSRDQYPGDGQDRRYKSSENSPRRKPELSVHRNFDSISSTEFEEANWRASSTEVSTFWVYVIGALCVENTYRKSHTAE